MVGDGNVILFSDLNSQFAAFMVKHFNDQSSEDSIRRLINEVARNRQDQACIGNNVKIVNTKEITNTVINDDCEINGAARLSDCTILSSPNSNVYIGTGVICELYHQRVFQASLTVLRCKTVLMSEALVRSSNGLQLHQAYSLQFIHEQR